MRIGVLESGDTIHRYKKSLVVTFKGKRRVLSTAPHNGGYREDLTAVFNNDCTVGAGMAATLKAPTYREHLAVLAGELGLDPEKTAGISTAAQMENAALVTEKWENLSVTALVTGGIEVNGGRVGDPASWNEVDGVAYPAGPGTINIMVFFNTDLSPGALTRALVTCTEAKTAAIGELLAPSRYSMGLATGSGTDGTILVSDMDSSVCLTDAGKHSKLGELIGRAVKAAVKEALKKQSGLCPQRQHQVLKRMDRFGLTSDVLWENYQGKKNRAEFEASLEDLLSGDLLVTYTSLYAHLLDQLMWGMLKKEEVEEAAQALRNQMGMKEDQDFVLKEVPPLPAHCVVPSTDLVSLIRAYASGLLGLIPEEES